MPNHLLIILCLSSSSSSSYSFCVNIYHRGGGFSIIGGDVEHSDVYFDSYDVFVNSIARFSTEERMLPHKTIFNT